MHTYTVQCMHAWPSPPPAEHACMHACTIHMRAITFVATWLGSPLTSRSRSTQARPGQVQPGAASLEPKPNTSSGSLGWGLRRPGYYRCHYSPDPCGSHTHTRTHTHARTPHSQAADAPHTHSLSHTHTHTHTHTHSHTHAHTPLCLNTGHGTHLLSLSLPFPLTHEACTHTLHLPPTQGHYLALTAAAVAGAAGPVGGSAALPVRQWFQRA